MIVEKKYYIEEDMVKLDDDSDFIPLTFDKMFKGIFKTKKKLLKIFILSQLEMNINPDDCEIDILDNELPKSNKKEYQKIVDIYVKIGNMYVNIEINREYFRNVVMRNLMFADKLYIGLLEQGENFDNLKNKIFVQINLNAIDKLDENKERIKVGSDIVTMKSINKSIEKLYNKNKYIMIKYLEYYRDLYYNEGVKLSNSEMWLVLLSSRNFQEVYKVSKLILTDDELHQEFIRKVIDMSKSRYLIEDWELEKLNELVEVTKYENAVNDGLKEGLERGIEQGIEQGIERGREQGIEQGRKDGRKETTDEYIIKMLNENLDIKLISKITNKTEEEIMEMKNSL